jgi:hypothetical protein
LSADAVARGRLRDSKIPIDEALPILHSSKGGGVLKSMAEEAQLDNSVLVSSPQSIFVVRKSPDGGLSGEWIRGEEYKSGKFAEDVHVADEISMMRTNAKLDSGIERSDILHHVEDPLGEAPPWITMYNSADFEEEDEEK